MDGVPESFEARRTAHGLVLRVRGEEKGTALAGGVMGLALLGAGVLGGGIPCYAIGALVAVFTVIVGIQSVLSHDLELALDEVRLVRRLGPLALRRVRVPLVDVSEVRVVDDRAVTLRVVVLETPGGPLRILGDGHTAEDVSWLRDTLEAMVGAARPIETPEPPEALKRLRAQRQSEPTEK